MLNDFGGCVVGEGKDQLMSFLEAFAQSFLKPPRGFHKGEALDLVCHVVDFEVYQLIALEIADAYS